MKSKLSKAKKSKTTTFSRVFYPKENRQFSPEIKVEFLDKKGRFRTLWKWDFLCEFSNIVHILEIENLYGRWGDDRGFYVGYFDFWLLQGKTAMPGMKRDCGGAAGILGAFYLAVKQGFSQNLHAIFCLAENAVGDRATRPDDIHTLYSGKTVEINNTDAEGNLSTFCTLIQNSIFCPKKIQNYYHCQQTAENVNKQLKM